MYHHMRISQQTLPVMIVMLFCIVFGSGCRPKVHQVVGVNRSTEWSVEYVVAKQIFAKAEDIPARDWIKLPHKQGNYANRGSHYLQVGTYYVWARKIDYPNEVHIKGTAIKLNSNNADRSFEGDPVAAVIELTPGDWSFRNSVSLSDPILVNTKEVPQCVDCTR
jgi:hypothetical protein